MPCVVFFIPHKFNIIIIISLQINNYSMIFFLDEFVAQFKSTLLLLPNGTVLATGIPIDMNLYESEYSITDEDLVKLLAENPNVILPSSGSKNKKKKKKSGAAASTDKENETNSADQAVKTE